MLCRAREYLRENQISDTDVRLRLFDGKWEVTHEDAQFDTDHRGFWGASSISIDDDDDTLIETAHNLMEQVLDAKAQP